MHLISKTSEGVNTLVKDNFMKIIKKGFHIVACIPQQFEEFPVISNSESTLSFKNKRITDIIPSS